MTYEEIISWIERKYQEAGYEIFSSDDIPDIRRQLIRDYDADGRLKSFLLGNDHMTRYMIEKGRARWTGVEGTSVEKMLFEQVEEPIILDLNQQAEKSLLEQLEGADNIDELGDIEIPSNLLEDVQNRLKEARDTRFDDVIERDIERTSTTEDLADIKVPREVKPEIKERLERSKTERFGELKGAEFRREIESPETEVSRLIQIERQLKRIPDETIRKELKEASSKERGRLDDLNRFLLQEIRGTTSENELDNVITRIVDSDLRDRQKDALRRVAEARRGLGFPEIGEV